MADESIHDARAKARAAHVREYEQRYFTDPANRAKRNARARGYREKYKEAASAREKRKRLARAAQIRAERERVADTLGLVIRTGAEAKASGLRKYFTGKPCKQGHIAERYTAGTDCVECIRLRNIGIRATTRRDPNKRAKRAEYARNFVRRRLDDPILAPKYLAKRRALGRRKALAKREKIAGRPRPSKCEICNRSGKIHWDHCHQSGQFRGWLCSRCNAALGLVRDDTKILRKLVRYLERHNGPEIQPPNSRDHDPGPLFGYGAKG